MRVEDFPRPKNDNRRGVHWSASVYHPTGAALDFWIDELQAMNIKWVKLLDDSGGSSLELCQRLLAADIMPIVRLYRLEPNPGSIGGRELDTARRLIAEGVRYFETNNEPDLPAEWKGGRMPPNWLEVVIDNFIRDADRIIGLGGLPALPAMGVGSRDNPIDWVVRKGRADLFSNGAWVAIHNYTLNHPLDYPYDSVNQEGTPVSQEEYDRLGTWAWEGRPRELINEWRASDKNPGATLTNDPVCFLAFHLMDEMIVKALGHAVPILSTEGGPVVGWKDDRRYPRTTPRTHADWTVAINDFMQGGRELHGLRCPASYFTMCHWLLANYRLGFRATGWESQSWYSDWWNSDFNLSGELPVVAEVKAMPNLSVDQISRAVVTGRVSRSDTDEPLPDLPVQLLAGERQVAQTRTAVDGAFRMERLTPGIYDLVIPPWGVVRSGISATEEPASPVTIRLTGGRSSVLTGTVQTAAGAPVVGARVVLQRDAVAAGETVTGADGAFRFSDLPLGAYRLIMPGITVAGIALDGFQAKSLKLTAGVAAGYRYAVSERRLLSVEETASRRIFFGVISDAAGAPLNGVKLQMAWHGAAAGTSFPVTTSGADPYRPAGAYQFIHSPGVFSLRVVQGDWPSDIADDLDTATVPGRAGQPVAYQVDFRLQAVGSPAQVDGIVPGGQPGQKMLLLGDALRLETTLAADGSFVFANLAPGSYRLELVDIGVIAQDIVLEPGALFKLVFPLRSRLAGRVLTAPDGLVAVLYAPAAWGWTRQALLDPNGDFVIENLPAGRYRLEVGGSVLSDLALTGENRLQLAPIDLAHGRHSVVRGRVADGAGRPQPDVLMTLRRDGVLAAQTRTAADGSYQFSGLSAGVYGLEATGLGEVVGGILLDGQREYWADVLWPGSEPRSALRGRVLAVDGAVVPAALVRLLRGGAEVARTQTDDNGAFRFTGLPGGLYALAVGEGDPLVNDIRVEEDATVTRDVVLPAGPTKLLHHYLLFCPPPEPGMPGYAEARLILGLAAHDMAEAGVSGGYSLTEATHAARVTILGDQFPATAEATLAAAGCQVSRVRGDGFAIAAALEQLFAEG